MNEKQFFSVLVRTVGLLQCFTGFENVWSLIVVFGMRNNVDRLGTLLSLLGAIFMLAIGVAMFRWPGWVVRLAELDRSSTIGRPPETDASN